MLISGYLHVKQDGLYKYVLASDGGSRLYVGQTPSGLPLAGCLRTPRALDTDAR